MHDVEIGFDGCQYECCAAIILIHRSLQANCTWQERALEASIGLNVLSKVYSFAASAAASDIRLVESARGAADFERPSL